MKPITKGAGVTKAPPPPLPIVILMFYIILNVDGFTKLLAVFVVTRSTRKREQWTYMYFYPRGEGTHCLLQNELTAIYVEYREVGAVEIIY